MLKASRSLCLDICDYENNLVCNLFDNTTDVSGQAHDVFVRTERNGWKELSFKMPSTCFSEEGEEENYRLQFLIADYRIRLKTENETDWYLISEAKVIHDKRSKNVEVTAGHIAQLLKTKNLDLEFSDEEGNNTGTAEQILTTILEGTGWSVGTVADFREDDGTTIKQRSFEASTNTGAFRLIEDMCELFDAKPIYHGDERTVDIVPMNPFSRELQPGEIPEEVFNDMDVLEIHYDKNLKNITRTVNTETMVTRLYAYGSYGDENGMCSIQTCSHEEYSLSSGDYPAGTEFKFVDNDNAVYYFTTMDNLTSSSELIYSRLDFMSRSYVWNKTTNTAYHVYKKQKDTPVVLSATMEIKRNFFPFLLSFDYYEKTGLLTENMFQQLAAYQQNMPEYYVQSEAAAEAMIANEQLLSETLESNTGMLKLAVERFDNQDGKLVLTLDTLRGDHGVLYRTDYDEAKRNFFEWHVAKQLKDNGDPLSGIGSVVYIIHDTDPVTWEIAYVKNIMDDNGVIYTNGEGEPKDFDYGLEKTEPGAVTLWLDKGDLQLQEGDRFFLFCSMSMSGRLSAKQVTDESVVIALQTEMTIATEKHPTYFAERNDPAPSTTAIQGSYGWYYKFSNTTLDVGELYFCYGSRGENAWHRVYVQETTPEVVNDSYFFNLRTKALYHGVSGSWVQMETAEDKRTAIQFSKVTYYCRQRDMIYHGLYEKYKYKAATNMSVGNYAFRSPYEFFWCATTDQAIPQNDILTVDTTDGLLWQDSDIQHVVSTKVVPYDAAEFPTENELSGLTYFPGKINSSTGVEEDATGWYRTISIKGYEETIYRYNLPANSYVACYNIDKVFKGVRSASGTGTFTTYGDTYYLRVVMPAVPTPSNYLQINNYSNYLYLSNKPYKIIDIYDHEGELVGISPLMKKFADLADTVFEVNYAALTAAQEAIKASDNLLTEQLGDLLREGYWQDDKYVKDDEERMYSDAMDNLEEISKPETTYDISYIDLYSANRDQSYAVDDRYDIDWPDIQITDAVHLVDPEIDINQWAYIDVINKCYDHPWDTTLEINTKLSLIGQHDFTDVLSRIAEVANETKAKQSIYKRAAALSSAGTLSTELIEGNIKANKALILGGSSNWYTDQKGNIVFESSDGSGAMMLTGYGILVASDRDSWGDWNWRTGITGKGITADEVVTAFLSAREALISSITTDMIHASVGQELDIGSNRALMLYATVSGERPAGGVKTGLHNADGSYSEVGPGDSYIEIGAKETTSGGVNPAFINIMTGGQMNVYSGSDMNIKSGADLFIENQGHFEVKSGGDLKIASGGSIDIVANQAGHFTVTSPNFNIKANGDTDITGKVTAHTGEIAGLTISYQENAQHEVIRRFMYSGTDSMSSTANGVYIGTDGVNLGGYLTVSKDGATAKFGTNTLKIDAVAGTMDVNGGTINITANSNLTISSGKKMVISSSGAIEIGTAGKLFTVGSNGTNAYIYNGRSSIDVTNVDGVYLGTDGLNIGKANGSYVKAKADGTIDISGKITATSGSIGGINVNSSYGIYTGSKTSSTSTETGFLIHKNGAIYLGAYDETTGKCPFQVTSAGSLTATNGTVGGWYIGSNYIGNVSNIDNSTAGMGYDTTWENTEYVFWAGGKHNATPKFSVTRGGALYSESATITGNITANTLTANTSGQIGGWDIAATELTGNKTGLAKTTSNTDVAFWAGDTSANKATAPFRVTQAGKLYATGAEISGNITLGGNNNTSGTLTIKNASGTTIGTWNNAGINATAGSIAGWKISSGELSDTNSTIGMSSAPSDGVVFWSGSATHTEAPFHVGNTGFLSSTNANIGGWSVGTSGISNGTDTSTVFLNSDTTTASKKDYAIWAGGNLPTGTSPAPFRVKRDGTVFLKNLVSIDKNGNESAVNLGASLWKLSGATVTGVTVSDNYCTSMTFSNAVNGNTTVNFNSAASVDFYSESLWSGGDKTITLTNGKTKTVSIPTAVQWSSTYTSDGNMSVSCFVGGKAQSSGSIADPGYERGWAGSYDKIGLSITSSTASYGDTITVYAKGAATSSSSVANITSKKFTYTVPADNSETGWTLAVGKVSLPGSGTSSSMSVKTPGSTYNTQGTTTYSVSADNTYAYIKQGSTTVARVSNGAYENGWAGCYGTVGLNSTTATTLSYGASVTVYAQAKATSGATSKTNVASRTITAPADNKQTGWDAAVGKVALPGSGTSASMSITTPGSSYNTSGATSYSVSADNTYAYIKHGSTTVARNMHSAYTNGQNSVNVSKGAWSNGTCLFSTSAGSGTSASATVSLTYTRGTGTNRAKYTWTIMDGQTSTGKTGTLDAGEVWQTGWVDGYNAAAGQVSVDYANAKIVYPITTSTALDAKTSEYSITAGINIQSITNTAPKTYYAQGYGYAYVNGSQINSKYGYKEQIFS